MDASVIAVIAIGALGLGALIGWLFGSRESASAKQTVETLRMQLDEVVKEREANRSAASDLSALRATQDERDRNYEKQLDELKALETRVGTKFQELAGQAVESAHEAFLKRADEKLDA